MASLDPTLIAKKGEARPAATLARLNPPARPRPAPAAPEVQTLKVATTKQTKKKSLRLSFGADKDLRLLAARIGISQQALMELAILEFLDKAFKTQECPCRTD